MRFGITILTDLPWADARPRWQAAEELGFDHAWTYDHLVWGGLPESPWTTATPVLGAAAQVTSRIGLGTLVVSPNFRHPYLLLRDAQALEDLSDGRFLLGVGTGGNLDATVLDLPELTVRERVDRFQEFTETLVALRDGDHVTREGRWFSTSDARTLPPLRRTPLLVAANGPRSLRFAARVGDGWVTTGPTVETDEEWWAGLAAATATFDEALATAGRGPTPRYLLTDAAPHIDRSGRFALTSRGYFEEVAGRAAELGFTDLVTHWPRPDEPYAGDVAVLEEVAREVLPGLR
ncbi:LLM class flavin-dependent oxidoreductase [Nocardioides sp.]|uniref:LLM class flavin-dependent oxidoreductase n=1 Tax=Nocardioides sp. TaxID=35761 RepID=UPI00271D0E19|nr:LLM class flavin-dependent oxidoreductase [Nocardioides sp.]MDO9455181.1 LLM class flavin-dependent oxidoreductase [Nocardioides sp.]